MLEFKFYTNGLDENIDDIDDPYEYEDINPLDCLAEVNDAAKHQNNEERIQDMLSYDESTES